MTNDIFCCKNWCKTIRTKWPGDCIIQKLWEVSSNINKVIKAVLNLFFFHDKILHAQKAQKRIQGTKRQKKHKNATKQKHKTQRSEQR